MIDYFAPCSTREEAILRRIKGNFRRAFVEKAFCEDGPDSVPEAWTAHDLSEMMKGFLGGQHPQARGGEDLPDLDDGEVEIARLSLLNSVHGEVTSLRARRDPSTGKILLRMVDEYQTAIRLPFDESDGPISAEQVVQIFRDADPSPMETSCEFGFQSFFYPDLPDAVGDVE